ncbi:MAG TPA: ABC transporter substrate-binding protein [Bryobacteraceae bacterium]|nr:ABC transporter substrate-binding protein [Bryobacteraceae bacterium]
MRIVSLLASGTEIVCALGAGDWLVGRSHECDNPAWVRRLPQCSRPAFDVSVSSAEIDREVNRRLRSGEALYEIDYDLIQSLKPDVIVAQSHCEVCAVTPADVNRAMKQNGDARIQFTTVPLSAATVEEIFFSIEQVGRAIGRPASALLGELRARLESLRARTAGLRRPTVAILEWVDPVFAMGNWGPELVEIAGGEPVLGSPGRHSHAIPAEQLRQADPEALIVAPCGFSLERAAAEQSVLEKLPGWGELKAVRSGRVAFADGNLYFNRSGMTIVRTAEITAEILHGLKTGGATEGVSWRWYTGARAHPGPRRALVRGATKERVV